MNYRSAIKSLWQSIFRGSPEDLAGYLLLKLLPKKVRQNILKNFYNFDYRHGRIINLLRKGLVLEYYRDSDEKKAIMNRKYFWGAKAGSNWHEMKRKLLSDPIKYKQEFLPERQPLVQKLKYILKRNPSYEALYEIGTGNGMFLDYLCQNLSALGVKKFVGIDINREQIRRNKNLFKNDSHLKFTAGEAGQKITEERNKNIIVISSGTLECFTRVELEALFSRLSHVNGKVLVGLIEPVSINLERDFESVPRGNTFFSHNYPFLLSKFGFREIFKKQIRYSPDRSTLILLAGK